MQEAPVVLEVVEHQVLVVLALLAKDLQAALALMVMVVAVAAVLDQ
jgi:hypothetical protein